MVRRTRKAPSAEATGAEPAGNDDVSAFREAMRDVKPLDAAPRVEVAARVPGAGAGAQGARGGAVRASARRRGAAAVREVLGAAPPVRDRVDAIDLPDPAPEEVVGGSETLSFRRPGVRDQTVRKLRRGLFPIEDELDLHGLAQAAARDELADFLAHQRAAGRRCVRIIHGKGYRSGARGPILKIAVNAWLKRHRDVIAFCSARPIDGGTGAVYVLLRA